MPTKSTHWERFICSLWHRAHWKGWGYYWTCAKCGCFHSRH